MLDTKTSFEPKAATRGQRITRLPLNAHAHLLSPAEEWEKPPAQLEIPLSGDELVVNHLRDPGNDTREMQLNVPSDHHRLWTCLRPSRFTCFSNGRKFNDGKTVPGMIHISQPNTSLRIITHGPAEHLYVSVPSQYLLELREHHKGVTPVEEIALRTQRLDYDDKLASLCNALAQESRSKAPIGKLYADGLGVAIVARLLSDYSSHSFHFPLNSQALSRSRLNRVREYIASNLSQNISLADLASVAGLSRMHFAGQFRKSVRMQPHEYVLQQRIESAKALLRHTNRPLLEIALSVGFKTQSHFTTVFKRLVGQTPGLWRSL